ncbi:cell wall / vacuolar inhibitor of fructosidase 2-like [Tasmannia lanceolata]|uniref:cell wall / vacuolar inhibitor of fructosidase 2-like n=1 Tax=Tasmannia lanceolata TaxID=3420 RepID=UPI004062F1B2
MFHPSIARVSVKDATPPLVDKVCKPTQYYDFCVQSLDSDPRAPTADLVVLSMISLDLMKRNATDTMAIISDMVGKEMDPVLKQKLSACFDMYAQSLDDIRLAFDALNSKSYTKVSNLAAKVNTQAYVCEGTFKEPPIRGSPLTINNENLAHLGSIATTIPIFIS